MATDLALANLDVIALTGDVTHEGKSAEGAKFLQLFGALLPKMVVIPGNHDRCGDDFASVISGERAWYISRGGLVGFICLDSTQPGNELMPLAWGGLDADQILYTTEAARSTPPWMLPVVLLHHHLAEGPADTLIEAYSDAKGWPFMGKAAGGEQLIWRLPGRCLVLHGHKHKPTVLSRGWHAPVYNAGSTTELGSYRVFEISGGAVTGVAWHTYAQASVA